MTVNLSILAGAGGQFFDDTGIPLSGGLIYTNASRNKQRKSNGLLSESDFSVLLDVNLTNKAAWETYRANIRAIAINPTIDPTWPIKPPELWS